MATTQSEVGRGFSGRSFDPVSSSSRSYNYAYHTLIVRVFCQACASTQAGRMAFELVNIRA